MSNLAPAYHATNNYMNLAYIEYLRHLKDKKLTMVTVHMVMVVKTARIIMRSSPFDSDFSAGVAGA
jgi:hypothetical protein